jgi:hypothetical protein
VFNKPTSELLKQSDTSHNRRRKSKLKVKKKCLFFEQKVGRFREHVPTRF